MKKQNHRKQKIALIAYMSALAVFTGYVAADTFLVSRVYTTVETTESTEESTTKSTVSDSLTATTTSTDTTTTDSTTSDTTDTAATTDTSSSSTGTYSETTAVSASTLTDATAISAETYSDDNVNITVTTYEWNDTTIYVADITLSSSDYLKTAFADNAYGKNVTETTSTIADSVNAILAINGDYYGAQESGYVIRNGVLYRDTAESGQEDLVIYSDGTFGIISEDEVTAQELLDAGAEQVLSFGPGLVEDGEISVTEGEEVGKAKQSNPRTAIGYIGENHYVMVVADGRTTESAGLSLYELAEFMQSLGCTQAYNLDGGGSSTMVFGGEVINNPTTDGNTIKERAVSDIVYIGE